MRRAASLIALAALAGCSLEPHYRRPEPAVARSWPAGDAYPRRSEAALPAVRYTDIFRDPKLQGLIARALTNNQDLPAALANIQAARAQYRIARSDLFPTVGANAGVTVRHTSGADTGTFSGNGGTGTTKSGSSGGNTLTSYSVEGAVSGFELDLFGRIRSLSHAALDTYLGTEAAARATRLTLVADLADAYFQLAADRSLLAIAVDTEKSAGESVKLTKLRLDGGVAPRTDLRQAETVLATAQSDHARQITLVAQDRNALELLVGAGVTDAELPPTLDRVDGLVGELPAGLDSTVLLRRPDVVEAEYTLRAANARIGAARAAFFPTISLTAAAGLASSALSSLFTGGAFTWSVAPSTSLPIFDGGALRGNLAYTRAQREVALAQYQKAIQSAFRDVADALARRGTIDREYAADLLLLNAAQDTFTLESARYREGIDTYLNTLDAQRTLYSARQTVAGARLVKVQNLVALYRTLGGDSLVDTVPRAGAR